MIDIRYHIYSIAAVFFALAVGIVIGTSFARSSPVGGAERRTIIRYENSMRSLKREIEKTAEDNARKAQIAKNCEEFCRAALPSIAKNRLLGRNVAIVQTGDYDDLSGNVKLVLELAGAHVNSVTDINRLFPWDDDTKIAAALTHCGIAPPSDPKEARNKLFSVFAGMLYAGQYQLLASRFEESKVAKFTGEYGRVNRLIVIVGGTESEPTFSPQHIDSQLISQLDAPDVTIVGCEGSQAVGSYISAWHKTGIATVDNVDSAIGQMALICALNGENAQFGTKENADRLIPHTLEPPMGVAR
ncbi:MAG: copper transporter [Armatimonadota bacterium]|nr:copper transporter [bacterium]